METKSKETDPAVVKDIIKKYCPVISNVNEILEQSKKFKTIYRTRKKSTSQCGL